jgi:hypothetical protein
MTDPSDSDGRSADDREMSSEESIDFVVPGFVGWLLRRHPLVTFSAGAIGAFACGVILLLSNPAGVFSTGDEYGPTAPLQVWVVVTAVLCFALSTACIAMVVIGVRYFAIKRRTSN